MIAIPGLGADPPNSKPLYVYRREPSPLWIPRKVACVVLEHDDMEKLLDREALTIDVEKLFPELGQLSVMFCHHDNKEQAIQAFKASFHLFSVEGKPI